VVAGERVTYTLVVTNGGPSAATNVRVLELVPAGTTVVTATVENPDDEGEHCSLGGSCYVGRLTVGGVATVTVVVEVGADFAGGVLVNTASVSADQGDPDAGDNVASATTGVTRWADLSLEKVAVPDPVLAGEVLLYQLTVTNDGPSDAENVTVTDTVPVSTTLVGASPECSEAGGLVTCELGTVGAGESETVWIWVRVDAELADGAEVGNAAGAASDTEDPDGVGPGATVTTTVEQPIGGLADVEITKIAEPDPVVAGELVTYTVVVTNAGPAEAQGVQVVDLLPDGVELVSVEASQGACVDGVVCDLGTLGIGARATVTIVVQVDSGQTAALVNLALVSTSNPDPDDGNNEVQLVIEEIETSADLSVEKTGEAGTAAPGETFSYEVVVRNDGPSDAQDVTVYDNYPEDLLGVTASASQGTCVVDAPADAITCTLGVVAAGDEVVIAIVGTIDSGSTEPSMTNQVLVYSETGPEEFPLVDTVTTSLEPEADLGLTKDGPYVVTAGEEMTYTLTVVNAGPSDAEGVVVTDTLPAGVTLVSGVGCVESPAGTVVCGPADMVAGTTRTWVLVVEVGDDVEVGTPL
jgi:uncharacterized repeat protein (TIGR01451 family)